MRQPESTASQVKEAAIDIRPFKVTIPQSELDELKRRILATRFPERETVNDISQGIQLSTIEELAKFWTNEYDWRKVESKLNSYPNFITEINGVDIHFIHARSNHENARPILLAHGWPGTIIEHLKIIDPLINPTEYGGNESDAFHVVLPSFPGYGFSGKPTTTGWDPGQIAVAWATLMNRLGYDRYFLHGTDWGAITVDLLAAQFPENILGLHSNMPGVVPDNIHQASATGAPVPAGLTQEEQRAYEQLSKAYKNVHYAYYLAARPQVLAGLIDSPIGLAAFLLDPITALFYPPATELFQNADDEKPDARLFSVYDEGLSRNDLLDIITLFWLTKSGVSASRIYWENKFPFFTPKGVKVPTAVSVFPGELYQAPKSWSEQAYPNLVYYRQEEKGAHFPSWERPQRIIDALRTGFRTLR